ncbi:unnamed protein product [Leuciscus chuanchicus]
MDEQFSWRLRQVSKAQSRLVIILAGEERERETDGKKRIRDRKKPRSPRSPVIEIKRRRTSSLQGSAMSQVPLPPTTFLQPSISSSYFLSYPCTLPVNHLKQSKPSRGPHTTSS